MNKTATISPKCVLIVVLFYLMGFAVNAQQAPFYTDIREFKKQDSISAPPPHPILFVGSSSFRMWKNMQEDFPGYTVINRGFGGSTLPDVIRYADDIIFPYNPKQIVIYCGDNDLASSDTVTAATVVRRFKTLFMIIRNKMPGVPVVFVAIKPSPSREKLLPKMKEANGAIKKFLSTQKRTAYADVYTAMIAEDGKIRQDIFIGDNLHMNETGYAIWRKIITPYLVKD